jgi:small-conductance mechanosensitive channel
LTVAIQDALAEADIEVPFPQRDLHLKTLPTP